MSLRLSLGISFVIKNMVWNRKHLHLQDALQHLKWFSLVILFSVSLLPLNIPTLQAVFGFIWQLCSVNQNILKGRRLQTGLILHKPYIYRGGSCQSLLLLLSSPTTMLLYCFCCCSLRDAFTLALFRPPSLGRETETISHCCKSSVCLSVDDKFWWIMSQCKLL